MACSRAWRGGSRRHAAACSRRGSGGRTRSSSRCGSGRFTPPTSRASSNRFHAILSEFDADDLRYLSGSVPEPLLNEAENILSSAGPWSLRDRCTDSMGFFLFLALAQMLSL
jgi:hypothetical protein